MTTSNYMPDVVVEIAFNAGYSTSAADRLWTDVSDWVELQYDISITRGRGDEKSEVSPSVLEVTLDNSDGRFTAGLTTSPYYPNVRIGRPIRVTVTPVGGVASTRFVGYVEEWPLEWDGTDSTATATLTAVSRKARLGETNPLSNIVDCEYNRNRPTAHYRLDGLSDITGTSPDLYEVGAGTAVSFTGTGPGTDGLSAAVIANSYTGGGLGTRGTWLVGTSPTPYLTITTADAAEFAMAVWFVTTGPASNPQGNMLRIIDPTTGDHFSLRGPDLGGQLTAFTGTLISIADPGPWDDGLLHSVVLFGSKPAASLVTDFFLYVDGVLVDTGSATLNEGAFTNIEIGSATENVSGFLPFTGTLAHAAVWQDASQVDAAEIHAAGTDAFLAEAAADRATRYAVYAGIRLAEVNADVDATTPMQVIDPTGQTADTLLSTVEQTEGGYSFDARDGTFVYASRASRYQTTPTFTLSIDDQQVESGMAPKLDRFGVVNQVKATVTGTETTFLAVDPDSVDEYGLSAEEPEFATTDVNEAEAAAWWMVNTNSEPRPRIPNLSVDVLPLASASQALVLAADIGYRFTVTGWPAQVGTAYDDGFFIEGYTEQIGLESYSLTFNVSPATGLDVLVLDSVTDGLLDTNTLAW